MKTIHYENVNVANLMKTPGYINSTRSCYSDDMLRLVRRQELFEIFTQPKRQPQDLFQITTTC